MRQNDRKRGRVAAVALAAAALIAATALVTAEIAGAADAARRAPRSTHVGVAASDLAVLSLVDPTGTPQFVRVNTDGTSETAEFQVPAGRMLVVTDVDFSAYYQTPATLGDAGALRIFLENTTSSERSLVFLAATSLLDRDTDSGGYVNIGSTQGIVTGFSVGSGARLVADCVRVSNTARTNLAAWADNDTRIVVRGYLTDAD